MKGKVIGAIVGGIVLSPLGLGGVIIGAAVGHLFDRNKTHQTIYIDDKQYTIETHRKNKNEIYYDRTYFKGPFITEYNIFALTYYFKVRENKNDLVSNMIYKMKYENNALYLDFFADAIIDFVVTTGLDKEIDIIVTCPTTTKRSIQPLESIAQKVSYRLNIPYKKVLVKKGSSTSQVNRSREERFKAVRSEILFLNDVHLVKGKNILLIDDVVTTGATMLASKEILLQTGEAKDVVCLGICKTYWNKSYEKISMRPMSANKKMSLTQRIIHSEDTTTN